MASAIPFLVFLASNLKAMVRRFAATLFLAGALLAQESSPETALRHAMELQQAGDLEGAVEGYREFLAAHPKEAAVQANLGVLLAHLGRYDQAVAEYKKALALDPNNAGTVRNLGLAYYKSGRIEEAAREFSRTRDLEPDNLQTTLLLGDCWLRMGQNKEVISLLKPVEPQNPDDSAIAYLLGTALIRDGQVQGGQERVDKILRKGDSAEARLMLGTQMFAAGDFPSAVKQLAGAAELNPSLPGLQGLYGQALLNSGDPDAAVEAFQKELAADPNHFEANFYLAEILMARSKWSAADPLVRRALLVRPESLEARLELADLEMGEGKLREAQRELEDTEKKAPKSAAVHRRLAEVYEKLQLSAEAEREKKLANRVEPRQAAAESGPRAGQVAPNFSATKMGSEDHVTLARLRHDGPILLIFGSYTCPNFRSAADTLNRLYPEYKDRIPFYLIYIREAHSTMDWQSTRNQREGISLQPAANMDERQDHATMCVRKLHIEFPTLLDSMSGAAEKAYTAWPSKAYLVDNRGKILFSTGLGEQDFHPAEFEAELRKVTSAVKESRLPRGAQ
jgi:tetratricopeptide (TPR) repeat protein